MWTPGALGATPSRSQLSQSSIASRATVVADDAHAAPATTSAAVAMPATSEGPERERRKSGIESAPASASAPSTTASPPASVAGQPAPPTATAAAATGRDEATRSTVARTNAKIASSTSPCISGFPRGSKGRRTR
jgi:hypothetical protein